MSKKKPKYLVDTSLVRCPIGHSSSRHVAYFQREIADGTLWTSAYIRMESIRVWVCTYIRAAILIDMYNRVDDALYRLEQDFSKRRVKANVAMIADYLSSVGASKSPKAAAEELGRLAVHWLRKFDSVFASRIQNTCGCRIGSQNLTVDFDALLGDLHAFYERFTEPVEDCEVNAFLQLDKPRGRSTPILENEQVQKLTVVKWLAKYQEKKKWITCRECERLGDAVIALEQPKPYTLVGSDSSFEGLCGVTGRRFKKLLSLVAVDKDDVPSI